MRYMGDSRVPAHDINVDTHRGAVTLFGTVPTHEARQAAERSARQVSGVRTVSNALQVVSKDELKEVEAKDEEIVKNVESAFKNMKEFEKVDVKSANGVVRLTGKVATVDDRTRAAKTARRQTGVRAVEDELKVSK
jgi:hyperosmotically inducible protein